MERATESMSGTRLVVGACCLLLLVPCARSDRRCPVERPISVGDTPVAGTGSVTVAGLPSPVSAAVRVLLPDGYAVSALVRTNFTGQRDVSDYIVFYDNLGAGVAFADLRYRAAIVRWREGTEAQMYPVYAAYASPPELAYVHPGDMVYRHSGGEVYAKTVGYFREDCWENVIHWDGNRFIAEGIDFRTADGFSYPVGPRYGTWPDLMPAAVTPDNDGDGWYVARRFQEDRHLGVDWNDERGGASDLGHPVFAAARGEIVYAGVPPDESGNPNARWKGVVVLRHRLVNDDDVFTLYGHLNVDPKATRADGSRIRVLGEVIRASAPGSLVELEKGQLIGYVGPKPDDSTGPHLHFEVIVDPKTAYNKGEWVGYRELNGDQTRWKDPTAFVSEHRSLAGPFEIGQGAEDFGVAREAFQAAWDRNQGPRLLGDPIGALSWAGDLSFEGPVWVRQPFQSGEVIHCLAGPLEGQAFGVVNPLAAKFRSLFFRADPATGRLVGLDLGPPREDVSPEPQASSEPYGTRFVFQNFEGGALELHLSGVYTEEAFEVHGEIFRRWRDLNYAAGPLGLPIADEREAARSPVSSRTGRFSVFEGGVIHWTRETGRAYALGLNQRVGGQADVAKQMAGRYKDEGGSGGPLGFPVSDDYLWQNGIRCDFDGGYISWLPSEGVRVVVTVPIATLRITSLAPSTVVGSSFTLTITGSGFDTSGAVDQVYKPDGSLMGRGMIQSLSSTQIVVREEMAGAAPGNYTVRVENPDRQVSNGMTLRLVAQVSVAPPSGPAGTQFSYQGSGFTGNHGATSHFQRPDGTEFSTRQLATNSSGEFSTTIDSTGFAAGTYQVWAVDNNTGISSNVVSFTVSLAPPTSQGLNYPVDRLSYIPGSYAGRSFYYDKVHLGEDISLPEGTPIRAIGDGRIVQYEYHSGYASSEDGTSIAAIVEHDLDRTATLVLEVGNTKTVSFVKLCSIYGHIRKSQTYSGARLQWKVGDYVRQGDIIGYVNDGAHNGDGGIHLHMGIRFGGHPGYWVYFGYENGTTYPDSNVKYFGAASEVIQKLSTSIGTPQVSVSPSSGAAGTQFSYQGSGFTGNYGVTSHLRRPDGTEFPTLQMATNASGQFTGTINSTGFAAGTYQVWAVDNNTGISSNVASFTVPTPGSTSQPELWAPWSGTAGISQGNFGPVSHNVCGQRTLERDNCNWENTYALDIELARGTEVLAPADGEITYVWDDISGVGGRQMAVTHTGPGGAAYTTVYLHLGSFLVRSGRVVRGQVIATSGASSGGSESGVLPHLHFHMWSGRVSRDSHTIPIENLVLKRVGVDSSFRRYDARNGELDHSRIVPASFESNNHRTPTPGAPPTTYLITTVAGNGVPGFSGDGGAAVQASLNTPAGIAVDAAGSLYIADCKNNRIRKVSPGGVITTVAGNGSAGFSGDGGPATGARLNGPQGVAVDPAGNLYIADTGNYRVRKVSSSGTITTVAGNGEWTFFSPIGDGGPAIKASLNKPVDVAIDSAGNLFVADADLFMLRVRKVSPTGIITTAAGNGSLFFSGDGGPAVSAGLGIPAGVAVDAVGNLYIATEDRNRIRKVTPGGIISTIAGSEQVGFSGDGGPATAASLTHPLDVAVDSTGSIYIADSRNQRIRKVTPDGTITTIAGRGPTTFGSGGFSGDGGPATSALLNTPNSVAADTAGNVYVSDQNNQRIRKLGLTRN